MESHQWVVVTHWWWVLVSWWVEKAESTPTSRSDSLVVVVGVVVGGEGRESPPMSRCDSLVVVVGVVVVEKS